MIFKEKKDECLFLWQLNGSYRWHSDYNAKLINDTYFKPKYPLRVYLVEHPSKKNLWKYFLIDFRFSPDPGEVFYTSDNATEMLEFILEHVVFLKTTQNKVVGTRYNNFRKKYNPQAVASLLCGFLCLFLSVWLFGFENIKSNLIGIPIYILNGLLCGFTGIQFSKIMYDEK
ncbi:MAG: hypothetical protein ACHQII_06860 [Bacteroidia bacterium]